MLDNSRRQAPTTSESASKSSGVRKDVRRIANNAAEEAARWSSREGQERQGSLRLQRPTDSIEDLLKAGVIDPTKVTRTALQNAASIAGLLLTTECVVVEKKEKDKAPPMPGGGGMGGDTKRLDVQAFRRSAVQKRLPAGLRWVEPIAVRYLWAVTGPADPSSAAGLIVRRLATEGAGGAVLQLSEFLIELSISLSKAHTMYPEGHPSLRPGRRWGWCGAASRCCRTARRRRTGRGPQPTGDRRRGDRPEASGPRRAGRWCIAITWRCVQPWRCSNRWKCRTCSGPRRRSGPHPPTAGARQSRQVVGLDTHPATSHDLYERLQHQAPALQQDLASDASSADEEFTRDARVRGAACGSGSRGPHWSVAGGRMKHHQAGGDRESHRQSRPE